MPLEFWIAIKYLKPRRDHLFITVINAISVSGVLLGVMSVLIVLTVLNGFEREVKSRFVGFDAHIKIRAPNEVGFGSYDSLMKEMALNKQIEGLSPFILEKAMITSSRGQRVSFIKATYAKTIASVTRLERNMVDGELEFSTDGSYPGIVIGLALALNLSAQVGDTVTIISPAGVTGPFNTPKARRFKITGLFRTDMFEYDNAYAFIELTEGQTLFELEGQVNGIDVCINALEESFVQAERMQQNVGQGYVVETWYDQHQDLYAAMKMDKWGSLILLCLIIIVAVFNIVSTLIMVVMQKTKEIGILKSLGATSNFISRIFLWQGGIVGGLGIFFGFLFGFTICYLQITFGFIKLPADVFFLDALPMEMMGSDFVAVFIIAVFLCVGSTVYPARKASQFLPVEAIKV